MHGRDCGIIESAGSLDEEGHVVQDYMGLLFLALPLLLLWMVFTRTRRQQRSLAQAQSAAQTGKWAMTTSGLHGQVVEAVDGDPTVLLEIAPGVRTRWARQAVAEIYDEDPVTRAARRAESGATAPGGVATGSKDGTTIP
jgi:preprotein translocase subunit YajC